MVFSDLRRYSRLIGTGWAGDYRGGTLGPLRLPRLLKEALETVGVGLGRAAALMDMGDIVK